MTIVSLQLFFLAIMYTSHLTKLYLHLLYQLQSGLFHPKNMNSVDDWNICLSDPEAEGLQAVNHTVAILLYYLFLQMRLCYHWYSKVQPDTCKNCQRVTAQNGSHTGDSNGKAVQEKTHKLLDILCTSMLTCLVMPVGVIQITLANVYSFSVDNPDG